MTFILLTVHWLEYRLNKRFHINRMSIHPKVQRVQLFHLKLDLVSKRRVLVTTFYCIRQISAGFEKKIKCSNSEELKVIQFLYVYIKLHLV